MMKKINIIVPFTNLTGGIKIIFEYSNRLYEKGYDVLIYAPMIAYKFNFSGFMGLMKRVKATLGNVKRGNKVKWFDLKVPIKLIPYICNNFVRDADFIIATAWPTAYDVKKLNGSKGKKLYFIQGYEIWSGSKEEVDGSYKLGLMNIAISKWIKDILENEVGAKVDYIIHNGIDFNEFYCENKVFNKRKKILMLYHEHELKGYIDGLKAFELVKSKYTDIDLILFGIKKGKLPIPKYAEFYENPSRNLLRELYCKSDIYLFPSRFEGFGLTLLEAMACKCAVVGTKTGILEEIGIDKENVLLSSPRDINTLAENIELLIKNNELLRKISENGHDTVRNFSWDNSVRKFMEILS